MKKIWYGEQLWELKDILKPTKFDTFLLCQRTERRMIHDDNKTAPVGMILINIDDDKFFLDSPRVKRCVLSKMRHEKDIKKIEEMLTDIWLEDNEKMK